MTSSPTSVPISSALGTRLAAVGVDIKLSHSIFALPFALLGLFLAAGDAGRVPDWTTLGLVVACMVTARTAAMTSNRWADAQLDRLNPRTQGRAIPSGRVSREFMLGAAAVSGLAFLVACAGFWVYSANPWPIALAPLVLTWLVLYSFAKRFTSLCHVILGVALAISPVAAAIAVEPGYLGGITIWLLALMVACWVAGFDIIYALQDVAVDRAHKLNSLPARFGNERALWISRGLHVISLGTLVGMWQLSPQLGAFFGVGVGVVGGLLILEHALVWKSQTGRLNMAFFTVNGVISVLLGGAGIFDILLAR